jgi:uncharacterized protein (UPF0333 family)
MDNPVVMVLGAIAVLVLVVVVVVNDERSNKKEVSQLVPATTMAEQSIDQYQNDAGQYVSIVMYEDFKGWLGVNKDKKIVSIASIDKSGQGLITAFVIVYEKAKKEN